MIAAARRPPACTRAGADVGETSAIGPRAHAAAALVSNGVYAHGYSGYSRVLTGLREEADGMDRQASVLTKESGLERLLLAFRDG